MEGGGDAPAEEPLEFDPRDPRIRADMVAMVVQYLQDEGLRAAAVTLSDEAQQAKVSTQGGHTRDRERAELSCGRRAPQETGPG